MRARHQRKPHIGMQLHLRLHLERIELCPVGRDDEVVYTGLVTPVVRLGRMLGVEVSSGPFVETRVDGEGALVHFKIGVAHDYHFVQIVGGGGAPVDAVGVGAVADVLPVFAVRLVGDEGAAVGTAEAVVDDCFGAIFDDGVACFF